MGFLFPSPPPAPSLPPMPPAAAPATMASAAMSGAMQNRSRMAAGAAASGFEGTLLTNPITSTTPSTARASLLGA